MKFINYDISLDNEKIQSISFIFKDKDNFTETFVLNKDDPSATLFLNFSTTTEDFNKLISWIYNECGR